LSLKFGNNTNELEVLKDIDFDVHSTETVVILGPSGCGKSTLLKLIGGIALDAKVSGNIEIDSIKPESYKKDGKVGFAFQNPVLLRWRNVFENVILPLELKGTPTQNDNNKTLDALKITGIDEFKNAYPNELSGGMKQRVNLARTIVHNPELLLLDEPFGSLDELSRLKLNFELREIIRANSYTTILITHSLREAILLGNRVIILTHRPATLYKIFTPQLSQDIKPGVETTTEFNQELKRLTDLFIEIENGKK
jgi:NitT/TauT family transport system ATP-binding protein